MKTIIEGGHRYNGDWLKSVDVREAKRKIKRPTDEVEKAWNTANGIKTVSETKPKTTKKAAPKKEADND